MIGILFKKKKTKLLKVWQEELKDYLKKNKVDYYKGHGSFESSTLINVTANDGSV